MITISLKNIKGFGDPPTTFELNLIPKKTQSHFCSKRKWENLVGNGI